MVTQAQIDSLKQYAYENRDKFPNANKKLNGNKSPKTSKQNNNRGE